MTFTTVAKAMKSTMLLGLALVATSALASSSKQTLELTHSVNVKGTTLKAGEYKLDWDGNGPNVEVSIMQGKNVVAKVPARLTELSKNSQASAAVTKVSSDGTSELTGIRFEGKKYALEIGDTGEMSTAGSSK